MLDTGQPGFGYGAGAASTGRMSGKGWGDDEVGAKESINAHTLMAFFNMKLNKLLNQLILFLFINYYYGLLCEMRLIVVFFFFCHLVGQ